LRVLFLEFGQARFQKLPALCQDEQD
jgi:hypothetical protein